MYYLLIVIACLLWGGSFVATRYALTSGGLGVFSLLAGRFLIAGLILGPLLLIWGRPRLTRKDLLKLFVAGLIYPGLYFLFETTGLTLIPAFLVSIIISIIPVITGITSQIFLKERLGLRGWSGVLLAVIGVALVVLLSDSMNGAKEGLAAVSIIGVLLAGAAAIMGAIYVTSARYLTQRYQPLTLTTVQVILGCLFFVPMAAMEIGTSRVVLNPGSLVALGFLGIGASVGAFLSFNTALSRIEAGRASLFLNIIPVVSLIFGWLLLGERMNLFQGIGGLVVIAGVLLASLPTART